MQNEKFEAVQKVINSRISCRGFLDKPVSEEILKEIVELSERSPTWKNAQSYELIAVSGNLKNTICEELIEKAKTGALPNSDFPYETNYPSKIKKRIMELAMEFYGHLKIERKDKPKREIQMLKNFSGFGSPTIVFCLIPSSLREWAILDLGIFLGHVVIAAESKGLSTCLQAALVSYPDIIRKYLNIGIDKSIAVGFSIGYKDDSELANSFYSKRVPIDEILRFAR
ncbi:MAG: nitroreductase [Leptospiraceae bacterium]|nr:nitroreductase [Leptospiraceae bacterium]MCK6381485.1 nitroreductase [Leptospiraceae bacterium]NUM40200.1 nitroreductase [Leptospiraceae bacterium]